VSEEIVDYVATVMYRAFRGVGEALEKSGMFAETQIRELDTPPDPEVGNAEAVIWLELTREGAGQWFVKRAGWDKRRPVSFEGTKTGSSRMISWLDSLEYALAVDAANKNSGERSGKLSATTTAFGTGFVVSTAGHVLSNNHVVDGCSEVRGSLDGLPVELTVVAADPQNDLALLALPAGNYHPARMREDRKIEVGEQIVVFGFPLSGLLSEQAQLTTGVVSANAGIQNDFRYIQISAPVQQGNSGGPVIDERGEVVGIVVSKLNAALVQQFTGDIPQNVNFAIKDVIAKVFLDAYGVPYTMGAEGGDETKLSPKDIAAEARTYTVHLECRR
jgi:S1-C subfamily serine protease